MKILKFYSQGCAPCKMIAPILEDISKAHNVEVVHIDVEADPRKAMAYGVRSVPTLVFEKDGDRMSTIIGMTNRQAILSALGVA